jgi:hypothetical protein
LFYSPETALRGQPRFFQAHTHADVLFSLQLEMKPHLILHLALDPFSLLVGA